MLTETGHNQSLGFAVPAAVVRYVYEQLRTRGVVRQSLVGVLVQTLTPALAHGLALSRGYGVVISDVLPGSPAEMVGLRPKDIVTVVDGASVSTLPYYAAMMYLHDPAVPVAVSVLRGDQALEFLVPAVSVDDHDYGDASIDPQESLISELGIFGKAVDSRFSVRNGLRSNSGIYVVARCGDEDPGIGLAPGDVIASLNGTPILSVQALRGAIQEMTASKPAVLQVERRGRFMYIERELDRLPSQTGARWRESR